MKEEHPFFSKPLSYGHMLLIVKLYFYSAFSIFRDFDIFFFSPLIANFSQYSMGWSLHDPTPLARG